MTSHDQKTNKAKTIYAIHFRASRQKLPRRIEEMTIPHNYHKKCTECLYGFDKLLKASCSHNFCGHCVDIFNLKSSGCADSNSDYQPSITMGLDTKNNDQKNIYCFLCNRIVTVTRIVKFMTTCSSPRPTLQSKIATTNDMTSGAHKPEENTLSQKVLTFSKNHKKLSKISDHQYFQSLCKNLDLSKTVTRIVKFMITCSSPRPTLQSEIATTNDMTSGAHKPEENTLSQKVLTFSKNHKKLSTISDRQYFQSLCKNLDLSKVDTIPSPKDIEKEITKLAKKFHKVTTYAAVFSPKDNKYVMPPDQDQLLYYSTSIKLDLMEEEHILVIILFGMGGNYFSDYPASLPRIIINPKKYPVKKCILELGTPALNSPELTEYICDKYRISSCCLNPCWSAAKACIPPVPEVEPIMTREDGLIGVRMTLNQL